MFNNTQEDGRPYPDLPSKLAVHTRGYKFFGIKNDPSLAEFIVTSIMPTFTKKRFWFGDSISFSSRLFIHCHLATTGAMIALMGTSEPIPLMGLTEPRGLHKFHTDSENLQHWNEVSQMFSGTTRKLYDQYVTRFGHVPTDLRSWIAALHFLAEGVDITQDPMGVDRITNKNVSVRSAAKHLVESSATYFACGVVAAMEYPDSCAGIVDDTDGNQTRLAYCRKWAQTWRPELAYLFTDV